MKTISLKLKDPYDIVVGSDSIKNLGPALRRLKLPVDAVIITTPVIQRLYEKDVAHSLKRAQFSVKTLTVPDGEQSKSVRCAFQLMESLARYDAMKAPFIIALGGGVIGDLAGFVASVYKRGIPYVQVPTTLLAQVDSAIGGKVAIDLSIGKNLIGSFYQPKVVWSDVNVLKTLSLRQIRNGLAEVIKYGIIYDRTFFEYLERNVNGAIDLNPSILEKIVVRCSEIKAQVVMADEKETKGIRTILNFGHTLGHAIEAAGKYRIYQHGEAIALGMRLATQISQEALGLSSESMERINMLISKVGLPVRIQRINVNQILGHMKHDKKFAAGQNRFVLAADIGRVKVISNIAQKTIVQSLKKYLA